MKSIFPPKLKKGDEIRVVAPACSMSLISEENKKLSVEKLESLGFKVTFGKHINETDEFNSSSIESRIEDLHDTFADKNVKMIMPVIGGFNSNQLLKYLDYKLIKKNPKILTGYSDITALSNAIFTKTGLVTYSGLCFSNFAMKKGFEYSLGYFLKCFVENKPYQIEFSKEWHNDKWYIDQENINFIKNDGVCVLNEGLAKGTIVGANLCTFNLLFGTEYMPSLKNTVLFIEDDHTSDAVTFDRNLQSLIHQKEFKEVKGVVVGRFEKDSKVTKELLVKIIKTKKELNKIPVIIDADFGHSYPMFSFPIGGEVEISTNPVKIIIKKH